MDIGEALKARRKERGLSQRGLARAAAISAAFVSQIENGQKQPSLDVLERIAVELGTTASDLLGDRVDPDARELSAPTTDEIFRATTLSEVQNQLRHERVCHRLVEEARILLNSERVERLGAYAGVVADFADMLEAFADARYRAMTAPAIILITAALGYAVDPADAWPDAHPHGHVDDLGVLAFAHALVTEELRDFHRWRAAAGG